MKHSEYVDILKSAGVEAIKKSFVKVMIKQLPFLASGPFNYVLMKVATKLAEELIQQGELAVFFKYIDFRTDMQAKDFEAAMMYNHTMQRIGTDEQKKEAEAKLVIALHKLASLRN